MNKPKPKTQEEAQRLLDEYGTKASAARACAMPRTTFTALVLGKPGAGTKPKKAGVNKTSRCGLSEEELRAKIDPKFQVRQYLEQLVEGEYVTQADLVNACQLNSGYKQVLESSEFESFRGKAAGTVYWGHPRSIKQLKDEQLLR